MIIIKFCFNLIKKMPWIRSAAIIKIFPYREKFCFAYRDFFLIWGNYQLLYKQVLHMLHISAI